MKKIEMIKKELIKSMNKSTYETIEDWKKTIELIKKYTYIDSNGNIANDRINLKFI